MCMWDVPRVSVRTILTGSHGSARQRAAISLWHLGRTRVALCSRGRESVGAGRSAAVPGSLESEEGCDVCVYECNWDCRVLCVCGAKHDRVSLLDGGEETHVCPL